MKIPASIGPYEHPIATSQFVGKFHPQKKNEHPWFTVIAFSS